MNLQNQTVLITGGSSGIGLELARQLLAMNNTVIICGRSAEKLAGARNAIPVHTVQCDVSSSSGRDALMHWLSEHHPECNVLVNNAAIVHRTSFYDDPHIVEKAILEIDVNLVAPIALGKLFLSRRVAPKACTIINITTGLIYAPRAVYPIYNATKAALHSFTQVLRHQLKGKNIELFEVIMSVVATPWHKGNVPKIAITPEAAVREMIAGLQKGKPEIRIGAVRKLYWLSRIAPSLAFRIINRVS